MRRALLAVLAGGLLLTAGACDDKGEKTAAEPTAAPVESLPPLPDYTADTKAVCGQLQAVYTGELRSFGTEVGKMVSYKEANQPADAQKSEDAAAAQLSAAGSKIRTLTAAAKDPGFQEAGATSAGKFDASAKDRAYFDKVKTLADLDKTLKTQMNEWLTPVSGYCEAPS